MNPQRDLSRFAWWARLHAGVSAWVSGASWWRLVALFVVLMAAGSLISNVLGLRDERSEYEPNRTVHITAPVPPLPAAPGRVVVFDLQDEGGDSGGSAFGARSPGAVMADMGMVALIMLFAYLVATKVVVRKTAESDAKVRSAVDVAERETMERQLVQARLQVLQAQVEPHFLFNTLAAVDYLIETDAPRASRMQRELITYLRGALPQMRQESSTLGRELKLIRSYLALIQMRIEDRLQVELAVPPELESAEFPPMVLQSVVENAIKHGIEPKPEGGLVAVSAKVQGEQLWVEVRDTGVGFDDGYDVTDGPRPDGGGIGLSNIRERLAMLYGHKGRITVRSDHGVGTTVRIGVPMRQPKGPVAP